MCRGQFNERTVYWISIDFIDAYPIDRSLVELASTQTQGNTGTVVYCVPVFVDGE
ncbi:MAG TPA: hypothetical protein VN729_08190 [Ktedonobacteraceae bacterium]|nr:hypothetical protein [Ktedonobacteraceae bacterium]